MYFPKLRIFLMLNNHRNVFSVFYRTFIKLKGFKNLWFMFFQIGGIMGLNKS